MDCRDFSENLQAYIDGELIEAEKALLEEHIENCASCSADLDELAQVNDILHKAFSAKPRTSAVTARVIANITGVLATQKAPKEVHDKGEEVHDEGEEEKDPGTSLMGTTLAGYKVVEKIGSGGMGTVYKAVQLSMNRDVALKVLYHKYSKDKTFVGRFIREARHAGRLNHPHIVRVYDVGQDNGYFYMSMEFVKGQTVLDLLLEKGRVPPEDALDIVLQTAQALAHAQKNSIIHRDVKPENIIIDQEGNVKLADLGLAKKTDLPKEAGATMEGQVMGTPQYMSPEQVVDTSSVDLRTDIYSLGATFYHMVTGEKPFDGNSAMEIMASVIHDELEFTDDHYNCVPKQLIRIISKMMAKDPADRHQTASELIDELARTRSRPFTYATATPAPKPRSVRSALAHRERLAPAAQEKKLSNILWLAAAAAGVLIVVSLILALRPSQEVSQAPEPRHVADTHRKQIPPVPKPRHVKPEIAKEDSLELDAKKEFDALLKLMTEFPEGYTEQLQRLEAIMTGYPTSQYAQKSQTLRDNIINKLQKAYADASEEANALRKAGNYEKAVALLEEFEAKYAGTDVADLAGSLSTKFKSERNLKFSRDTRVADMKLRSGDPEGAIRVLEKVAQYGTSSMKEEASERIHQIETKIAAEEKNRERQHLFSMLDDFYRQTIAHTMEMDLKRAAKAVRYMGEKQIFSEIRSFVELEKADLAHLERVKAVFDKEIKELVKSPVLVSLKLKEHEKPVRGKVKPIGQYLALYPEDKDRYSEMIVLTIDKFPVSEIIRLIAGSPELAFEPERKYYLLHLYDGNFAEALKHLDKLSGRKWSGGEGRARKVLEPGDPKYAICYDKVEALRPVVGEIVTEREAKRLYKQAKLAHNRKNYREAVEISERLLSSEFASAEFLDEQKRKEIAAWLSDGRTRLAQAPAPVKESKKDEIAALFNAEKWEKVRNGYRFTYDFSKPEQLKDFIIGGKPITEKEMIQNLFSWTRKRNFKYEDAPEWAVVKNGKHFMLNGRGDHTFTWKGPLVGDVTLEFSAIPIQPKNVMGVLCANEKGMYVFAASCQVGDRDWRNKTFGRGNNNVAYRRHFGKKGSVKRLEKWEPSKEHGKKMVKPRTAYTVKLVKEGKTLTMYFNGQQYLQGSDGTWNRGLAGVRAYQSNVLFTNIKITGTLDPKWVEEQLRKQHGTPKKKPDRVAQGDPYKGASDSVRRLLDKAKKIKGVNNDDLKRLRKIADGAEKLPKWGGKRAVERMADRVSACGSAEELRRLLDEWEKWGKNRGGGRPGGGRRGPP